MVTEFVGRRSELAVLDRLFSRVVEQRAGTLVAVRGRRQVGKSRLAEEFLRRTDVPSAFFAASRAAPPARQLDRFVEAVAESSLPAATTFQAVRPSDWLAALRLVADQTRTPSVVVIDELPYLLEGDREIEGLLQTAWDRNLSRAPIMLLVLGSNLSMMEHLSAHGSPLFGRVRDMRLEPLTVHDTALVTELPVADAYDAHLVTGGYPRVLQEWQAGTAVTTFIEQQLADATSPLIVVGERVLATEFPETLQAGVVLRAIGAGERTFGGLAQRLDMNHGSLTRALQTLSDDARIVQAARPLSRRRSRDTRYLVADPYLRFWLQFIAPRLELLFRGRAGVVVDDVLARWPTYRGTAVEPLVRASIERLLPRPELGETRFVGSFWSRTGDIEVDLVGADRDAAPANITMIGSVKWRTRRRFDRDDLLALAQARAQVPGAEGVPLVGVSRAGFETSDLDVLLTPDDLIAGWR